MSDFDAFMQQAQGEALDVFGTEEIVISGEPFPSPLRVRADWNEVGQSEEVTLTGRQISFTAMVMCAASQFRTDPKEGQTVLRKKTGKTYRIAGEVHKDALTITFPLGTVHA
jgi:hypothetical protein